MTGSNKSHMDEVAFELPDTLLGLLGVVIELVETTFLVELE